MRTSEAIEYLKDIMEETDIRIQEIADLLTWAYDKGWTDGLEDYHEEREEFNRRFK
jgi:hypothetical protein